MALTKVPSNLDAAVSVTQSQSDNSTNVATTAYVDLAISNLSDSAPAALNTLNEIAAALGDNENYAATTTAAIADKLPLAGGTISASGDTPLIINTTNSNGPHMRFQVSGSNKHFIGSGTGIGGMGDADDLALRAYDNIFFGTGNSSTTRMTINASGNVGIGTTTPDSPLEISGADDTRLKLTDTGDSSELMLRSDGVNTQIYTNTAHDLGIYTSGNVGQLHLKQSNGNVGIGTNNPVGNLHIVGGDGVNGSSTIGGSSNDFIIENNSNAGMTIRSGANEAGVISFADPDSHNVGQVYYMHDIDAMKFTTNSAVQMTVDSAGKVGIGTTAPDLPLHVNGANGLPATSGSTPVGMMSLRAKAANASHGLHMGVSNASPWGSWLQAQDANNLATEYPLLLNPNGGNVGIGVTDPEKKLEVKSDTTYDGILIDVLSAPEIRLRDRGNSDTLIGTGRHGMDGFHIDTYSGNALFIEGSNRNVGIGTTNPAQNFVVAAATNGIGIELVPGTLNYIQAYNRGTSDYSDLTIDAQTIRFGIDNGTERLRASSTGLKVGTSGHSAVTTLDVHSSTFGLPPTSGTGFTGMVRIGYNDNRVWNGNEIVMGIINAGAQNYAGYIQCKVPSNGAATRAFLINPQGGRVGIGTDTPAGAQLHVYGGSGGVIKAQNTYGYMSFGSSNASYAHHQTDRGTYYFPVACQASGGFSTYSDSRLKENVEPVTGALDKVAIMNGVTFTWDNSEKAYGPEGKQFGVLAQNMLEVDSDLPSLKEDALESQENIDNADLDTQYYTMDYTRLTPFFIEAIKELKTKLEAAEARLAVLEG